VLCHYALRTWNGSHRGALRLYGHSHGGLAGDSQSVDVGVDCWDFRPVTLDEIRNAWQRCQSASNSTTIDRQSEALLGGYQMSLPWAGARSGLTGARR
jgi:hypothetical protein